MIGNPAGLRQFSAGATPCYTRPVSRYDLFRRRLAPIALVLAIALIARDTCNKQDRTRATFVFDFGADAADVRAVDVEVWHGDDQLSVFHRPFDGAKLGPATFVASLPSPDVELRIDVELASSVPHVRVTRRVHADDGATVTIRLEPDLHGRAP